MRARWVAFVGTVALALAAPLAPAAVGATKDPAGRPAPGWDRNDGEQALTRLRRDARAAVRVHRAADGAVDFVGSSDGRAMVEARVPGGPVRTAADQIARYGEVFGVDGTTSRALVTETFASATGGSVVRAEQVVDGVPVFGGQLVLSLDADRGVVSVGAATTPGTEVPPPVVSEDRAAETALRAASRTHRLAARDLTVTHAGRHLYDPALVHLRDPLGTRPVWRFEVTNGLDVRETVLVGTGRGEVALHFNDVPGIDRRVCDNAGAAQVGSRDRGGVPACDGAAARSEATGVSAVADVNEAFDHLGATSRAYADLGGIDLTALIGASVTGGRALMSTVRWCFADLPCPFANAFWDGRQMVFGQGWAAADDVVAHELTHGYVERTAGLFALHQSGTLNESLADVLGEIVDQRSGNDDDSAWTVGEDLPGGVALRSLKDPPLFGQPDRMTSGRYVTADLYDDNGAIHVNDGVGNKTAYLISQGGSFNGRSVTGVDGTDRLLAKTGRLYLEVVPRLTSGAEYADLGLALGSTCDELAAARVGGFLAADCVSVRAAVAATELMRPPVDPGAAAPEAAIACPPGHDVEVLRRDDDTARDFGWTMGTLWQRTPENGTPSWAREGSSSLFAWNPDPAFGEPSSSSAISEGFTVPSGRATYLHFHHAYALEFVPAGNGEPAVYYDGAQVLVQTHQGGDLWSTQSGLSWTNGPDRKLESSGIPGFGGDSHGYGSSQVDLSSLAGQTVRVAFKVVGDARDSLIGWWVDDVRLFACRPHAPSAPTGLTVQASRYDAVLTWNPPARASLGVQRYDLWVDGGHVRDLAGTTRRFRLSAGNPVRDVAIGLSARDPLGQTGARATVVVRPTVTRMALAATGRAKRRVVTVTGTVTARTTGARVRRMPMVLLRRHTATQPWQTVARGTSSSTGTTRWRLKQSRPASYQVVSHGFSTWYGSAAPVRRMR